jgi:hypothetical protein
MIRRILPLAAALGVLIASGLVHGVWTQRWETSHALEEACARVAQVPAIAGGWTGSNLAVDEESFRQARAVAYWMRRYTKEGTKGQFAVILMCGRADHMAVHTPDICYPGAGYEMAGAQEKKLLTFAKGSKSAEFWTARFRQPNKPSANPLYIWWTWGCEGAWRAPASPRWQFGRQPFLYKLYVAHDNANDNDTAEFLRQLLPTLENAQ